MSNIEKGGLQNLCVHGIANLQCYLTLLGLHHQNKLSSVHHGLLMSHYFELSREVVILWKFVPSQVLQTLSETPFYITTACH